MALKNKYLKTEVIITVLKCSFKVLIKYLDIIY